MMTVIGILLILHGLVHLLYLGQARRVFELRVGMVWPDRSWLFSRHLAREQSRWLACLLCVMAAVGFGFNGLGIMVNGLFGEDVLLVSVAISSVLYLTFWDGKLKHLDNQGVYALVINFGLWIALLFLK